MVNYWLAKQEPSGPRGYNFEQLKKEFAAYPMNDVDGLKIDFENELVHLMSSNTEPIMRIYTEAKTQEAADALADKIIQLILKIQ